MIAEMANNYPDGDMKSNLVPEIATRSNPLIIHHIFSNLRSEF